MQIKHYRVVRFRVRDPLHPGQFSLDRKLEHSGTDTLVDNGVTYQADEAGWFDLPDDVAARIARFPGWRTSEQVDEAVAAGEIRDNDSPLTRPAPARKAKAAS